VAFHSIEYSRSDSRWFDAFAASCGDYILSQQLSISAHPCVDDVIDQVPLHGSNLLNIKDLSGLDWTAKPGDNKKAAVPNASYNLYRPSPNSSNIWQNDSIKRPGLKSYIETHYTCKRQFCESSLLQFCEYKEEPLLTRTPEAIS
jgi:hypothetical protein